MAIFRRLLGFLRPYRRGVARLRRARRGGDGHDRRDPVADRPRDRPDHATATAPGCARSGSRSLVAGVLRLALTVDPPADRRARLARRRARPARAHVRPPAVARARASSTASRPASSCRARPSTCSPCASSSATGSIFMLQSALTILLAAVAMFATDPGWPRSRSLPVPFVVFVAAPLRAPLAPGAAGGPAADRRADRRRRGERRRRARGQGVRARGAPARRASATASGASSTSRWSRRGCRPSTTRSSASCRSSGSPRSCSSAGARSSTAT